MSTVIKEKVKRYIKANYGQCSVHDVSKKFGVSQNAVEEYIIDELPYEMEEEQGKRKSIPERRQGNIAKWVKRTLIIFILLAVVTLIIALTISQLSGEGDRAEY